MAKRKPLDRFDLEAAAEGAARQRYGYVGLKPHTLGKRIMKIRKQHARGEGIVTASVVRRIEKGNL